jgi:hypothetical protein
MKAWVFPGLLVIPLIMALAMILWVVANLDAGFDISDESYYILSIADYDRYPATTSQFGIVYHPLYLLFGGSIFALRLANVALTVLLSTIACWCIWPNEDQPSGASGRILTCGALSVFGLMILNGWLPTPNYNSLVVQALMIAVVGFALSMKDRPRTEMSGFLLGVGGGLLFLSKPPAAALFAVLVLAGLVLAKRLSVRLVVVGTLASLAVIVPVVLVLDGSISMFAERLLAGAADAERIKSAYGLGDMAHRYRMWPLAIRETLLLAGLATVVMVTTWTIRAANPWRRTIQVAFLIGGVVSLGLVTIQSVLAPLEPLLRLAPLAIGLGMIGGAVLLGGRGLLNYERRTDIVLCAVLLGMPLAGAFGTNTNTWLVASLAALLWMLAGVLMLVRVAGGSSADMLFPGVTAGVMAVIALVVVWMDRPYRQTEPIAAQASVIDFGAGGLLRASRPIAEYAWGLQANAHALGLAPGQNILDLTGRSPGAVVALAGHSIADAWLIGGYPGSVNFVRGALDRTACREIANAWVIAEPGGTRSLPLALAAGHPVAPLLHPVWAPHENGKSYRQIILRPTDPASVCSVSGGGTR